MNDFAKIEEIEKEVIQKRLRMFEGNKDRTAISLGIARNTLTNKLAKYERDDKERKEREDKAKEQAKKDLILMRG